MSKFNQINYQIRTAKVRLIDQDGQNIGVVTTAEALEKAKAAELDLVAVSGGDIPTCKILDYNKFRYDKKAKQKTVKSKSSQMKELIIKPNIGLGDLDTKINRAKEFISDGNSVRFKVMFKGREKQHPEHGTTKLKIIVSELGEVAKIEKESLDNPNAMFIIFMPR